MQKKATTVQMYDLSEELKVANIENVQLFLCMAIDDVDIFVTDITGAQGQAYYGKCICDDGKVILPKTCLNIPSIINTRVKDGKVILCNNQINRRV